MTTTVKITGMTCGHCVAAVKSALQGVPGVKSFDVQIGEATIESDGALNSAAVKDAIAEEGYEVVSVG